jgi:hypothetical protein
VAQMVRPASWFAAIAAWIATAACVSPPVEAPKTTVYQDTPVRVPQNAQNKVDVLFMVDNSPSMDAMQSELKAHFGDFFDVFQNLAKDGTYADLHIGVVTSDYGAGDTAHLDCDASPGGQRGHLQPIGAHADAGCLPPMNAPFIEYAFDPKGGMATSNLPAGQDLVKTFTCMASVGSQGCGFEHQLESVYAALKNTNENKGFLRSGALLTVVFVTNEDDGSAAPNAKLYEYGDNLAQYGAYDTYRQTRFAVDCGGGAIPYDHNGAGLPMSFTACNAAPNPMVDVGLAYDISPRYTTLFSEPAARGGIKPLATDVILFGIDGPETPFATILADSGTGDGKPGTESYVTCGPMLGAATPHGTCVMRVQHSCQNKVQPAFFADPAVRLNAVINSAKHHQVTSICGQDPDHAAPDFKEALQSLAALITWQIGPGCIPALLPDPKAPNCTVQDVTTNPDGSQTIHVVPRCDQAGSGVFPCWKIEAKDQCAKAPLGSTQPPSPQGLGMTIDRNGQPAPDGTDASVECETEATTGPTPGTH